MPISFCTLGVGTGESPCGMKEEVVGFSKSISGTISRLVGTECWEGINERFSTASDPKVLSKIRRML